MQDNGLPFLPYPFRQSSYACSEATALRRYTNVLLLLLLLLNGVANLTLTIAEF